jgi:hypothetical protein
MKRGGKEELEIPAECEKFGSIFDLNDDLICENWNKTISEVLKERYGSCDFRCLNCRNILRIIERGNFKLIFDKSDNGEIINLELLSENGERRTFKLKNSKEFRFENFLGATGK